MPTPGRLNLTALFVSCVALFSSKSALAGDEIEDIENVPTPTQLIDLLPPGGIDAVDINFWLIWSSRNDDGEKWDSMYMRWCIEPRNGLLYVEHIYGSDRGGRHETGYHYRKRFKYTSSGKFKSYAADLHLGGGERREIAGTIVDDQMVLKTTHRSRWMVRKPTISEHEMPLSTFDQAVPVEWMPLIIAYHIRKGSLGYNVKTMEFATGEVGHTRVEDMGTELYQYGAQLELARFLGVEIKVDRGRKSRHETLKMLTERNGNYFQIFFPGNGTSIRRSTIEEVCKVFGVKQVLPGRPNPFNPAAYFFALPQ